MAAQTVRWLIFLALLKDFSHGQSTPFELDTGPLSATEGSCIEIKCSVSKLAVNDDEQWFWIKDAQYNESRANFDGTVIYSYGKNKRTVSPMYSDRVNYTGSPSQDWSSRSYRIPCNILICNLMKSDNGTYKVRFEGKGPDRIWITQQGVVLTVEDNLCPITFEKPPVLNESDKISLNCSTLSSCPSNLIINGRASSQRLDQGGKLKGITIPLQVTWMDHGREFSCQTQDNKDKYLIQKITLTVEYAPKQVLAGITKTRPTNTDIVKEGDSFTLTCTAKGHPDPTLRWVKNGQTQTLSGAEWRFNSVKASDDGVYLCEATNKLGTKPSNPVPIDVKYAPEIELKASSTSITEGNMMTLTCRVKRSKPSPHSYLWFKNNDEIFKHEPTGTYVVQRVTPEDAGSYKCQASNQAGPGTSKPLQIKVRYRPRNTKISVNENEVRVGSALTFTCKTDAHPDPSKYSWYRYSTVGWAESSWQRYYSSYHNTLHIEGVQRADEACYTCNATNSIDTGDNSEALCIQVHYPPTTPTLTMEGLVKEGQTITISCRVESFPPSVLTLTRTSVSGSQTLLIMHSDTDWHPNNLQHTFNVTASDRGSYTCKAKNDIGPEKSEKKDLLVKYRPTEVTVQADPGVVVNENTVLKLLCNADSYPRLTSVTWMKMRGEKSEKNWETQTLTFQRVSPSDSGWYRCAATNEMGTGQSQPEEIKVRYAPKYTKITKGAETAWPNGKSSVTLSCSSQCYPPATQFTWYRKAEQRDIEVSILQTFTVTSDEPGDYYCIAENEISQKSSDLIPVYFDRGLKKIIIIVSLVLFIFIIVIFFIYGHKRNKTICRRQTNRQSVMDSLSLWIGMRRSNFTNEQPFRSRDDLLTDQPCHSNGQRRQQPHPDSTPVNNIHTVYSTVCHPARQQGPSGEMPIKQKAGHKQDESLNYASLHFGKKQNKTEADAVYAKVSKRKQAKKNEEKLEDYENIESAHAAKLPNPLDYDSDTSEDDVELNYSQVSYTPKPGHQRANGDSSSSDAEETQYSEVKI